jgi:hypothetical protein
MWKSRCLPLLCLVLGAVSLLLSGCSSAPGAAHSRTPGVTQIGEQMMRSVGADMEAILGYQFAETSLGDEWLVVDLALTALGSEAIKVSQEMILVVTPDGRRIKLPTQKEFNQAYPEIQSFMRRAAIASQPLEATRGGRRPCELDFLRLPGSSSTTRTAIWINNRELCVGMLAFPIQGGIQPGRWRLIIELEESNLEVPFLLGQ